MVFKKMACTFVDLGTAGLGGKPLPCDPRRYAILYVEPLVNFTFIVSSAFLTVRTMMWTLRVPRKENWRVTCVMEARTLLASLSAIPPFPCSLSWKADPGISLGKRDSKNLPQTKRLELVTCVP